MELVDKYNKQTTAYYNDIKIDEIVTAIEYVGWFNTNVRIHPGCRYKISLIKRCNPDNNCTKCVSNKLCIKGICLDGDGTEVVSLCNTRIANSEGKEYRVRVE